LPVASTTASLYPWFTHQLGKPQFQNWGFFYTPTGLETLVFNANSVEYARQRHFLLNLETFKTRGLQKIEKCMDISFQDKKK